MDLPTRPSSSRRPDRVSATALVLLAAGLAGLTPLASAVQDTPPPETPPQESDAVPPPPEDPPRHPANRLAKETSPYLQQHAHNPVDWYPWGEEAFTRAREEDKPIFLSIGYAACHWCHVMERESFEDEEIAALMNRLFVNVKVDREERPDVDELYMKGVQALTGGGGWPMSVWLMPDGRPFYGGTYFPPEDRFQRPGFPRLCEQMAELYRDDRARVEAAAEGLTDEIQRLVAVPPPAEGSFDAQTLARAASSLLEAHDPENGGFGGRPKFPHPMDLGLMLRLADRPLGAELDVGQLREAVELSLRKMARGGIYDQLGGGFHRYSVDERWLIPHFEKMLYDNALLADCYLDAWLTTGEPEHRRVVVEILDYVLREMTSPEGGFYSTQDADSEGEEGKFFAWDRAELAAVLGEEVGARFADFHGVTAEGNFEHGKSALWRPTTHEDFAAERGLEPSAWKAEWAESRARMFQAREARVKPGRDEKILVDWNGLMIGAMARAGFHLQEPRYLEAAQRAADFVRRTMDTEGGLVRAFKDGRAHIDANLGDYANLVDGLLDLYQADFDPAHLAWARELTERSIEHFWDEEGGGFFFTADDAEVLIARSKEAYDGATPSAPSMHASNLLRLASMLGEPRWRELAETTLALYGRLIQKHARAVPRMVEAVHFQLARPQELVLAADRLEDLEPFLEILRARLHPGCVILVRTEANAAELEAICESVRGKSAGPDGPRAHVCRDFVCEEPIAEPARFAEALGLKSP